MCKENMDIEQINAYYGLEDHLKSFRDIPLYEKLCCSWEVDKQKYINYISANSQRFPHYSDHGEAHSKKIISSIEFVLGKKRIKQLSVSDTWLLLQCAYSHDLGMSISAIDLIHKMSEEKTFYKKIKELCEKEESTREAFEFIQPLFDYYLYKKREGNIEDYDEYIAKTSITQRLDAKAQYDIFTSNDLARWPIKLINAFTQILESYARPRHGEFSEEMLMEDFSQLCENGIVPIRLRYLVARISSFHMKDRQSLLKEFSHETLGICNDYINPRFAAIMLRLGDLLDLDNGRFNQSQLNILGETPYTTLIHQFKHEAITHFLITPLEISIRANFTLYTAEKLLKIQRSMEINNITISDSEKKSLCMKACKALNEWLEMLRKEIEFLSINWLRIVPRKFEGSCPKFIEPVLMIDGIVIQKHELNLSYQITTKRSAEIIEGSGLYSEPQFTFLREVLQNALDATKIQMYLDVMSGMYPAFYDESGKLDTEKISKLTPICFSDKLKNNINLYRIEYNIEDCRDKNQIKISIRDYGVGITYSDLQGMLKIGNSSKTEINALLNDMPIWLKPTGSFGIGLQSIFYVAKSFKIYSRPRFEKEHITPPLREMVFYSTRMGGEIEVTICDDKSAVDFGYGTEVVIEIDFNGDKDKLLLYANRVTNHNRNFFDLFSDNLDQLCHSYENYLERLYSNFIIQLKKINNTQYIKPKKCSDSKIVPQKENIVLENTFGAFCILLEHGIIKKCCDNNSPEFSCWSEKYRVLIKYMPSSEAHDKKTEFSLYYKGIKVNSQRIKNLINIPFWNTEIHLFSEYANALLEISREEILPEKINEIVNSIYKVHFCCLKFIFNNKNIHKYNKEMTNIWLRSAVGTNSENYLHSTQTYLAMFMYFISNKEKLDVRLRDRLIYSNQSAYNNKQLLPCDTISYFVQHDNFLTLRFIDKTKELSVFCNIFKQHDEKIWYVANNALPHCDLSLQYAGAVQPNDSLMILEDYLYNYPQIAADTFRILIVTGWKEPVIVYKLCRRSGEIVKSDENDFWKLCINLYKNMIRNCHNDFYEKQHIRLVFPSNYRFEKISVSKLIRGIEHKEITKFNSYIISPLSLGTLEKLIYECQTNKFTIDDVLETYFSESWMEENKLLLKHIASYGVIKNKNISCNGIEDTCEFYLEYKAFIHTFLEKFFRDIM